MVTQKKSESLILLAIGLCAAACDLEPHEPEEIGSAEEALWFSGDTWPGGVVPVCWSAASQSRPDFANRSQYIHHTLETTWPAVSDVEFTGWGSCPANTSGMVVINLINGQQSGSLFTGYAGNVTHSVNFGVGASHLALGLVPHEFGHVLGFQHEMSRPDFEDDTSGGCQDMNFDGDPLGTPADRESIMASGYCQSNPILSRWDRVGIRNAYGTRAENVVSTGTALYARKRSTGDIYRQSGSAWVRIGSPGGQFISIASTLYGLTPSGHEIYRYDGTGTNWTQVGTAATEILRCAASLCAVDAETGDLMRYSGSGMTWSTIGDPAAAYASTSTKIYRLTLGRLNVEEYSGSGTTWTVVGGAASSLFATTTAVYLTDYIDGTLYRYTGTPMNWTEIGGQGRMWVGVGSTLYGLTPTRGAIWRNSGSANDASWTEVGGAADWIYGGPSGALYATAPATKDIWRYDGSSWVNMGQP